jgi:hypothetical protein
MDHRVRRIRSEDAIKKRPIPDVADLQLHWAVGQLPHPLNRLSMTIDKAVDHNNVMSRMRKLNHCVAADIACTTCD